MKAVHSYPIPSGADQASFALSAEGLSRLTKLYLLINDQGVIKGIGPTLQRLLDPHHLIDETLFSQFDLRAPDLINDLAELKEAQAKKLQVIMHKEGGLRFRGTAINLSHPAGWFLINLSFGVDIAEIVGRFRLNTADFAPTDLAMELLYLTEANAAVVQELRALSQRREQARQQAEQESMTDSLTGLRNRRAFDSIISRLCREGKPFALMQLDLDYFKQVNDTLGHAAGDHVLITVATALRDGTTARDFIARLGGDEFVMLLPGTAGPARLTEIGQHLITAIREPIFFENQLCRISASIGVASVGRNSGATPAEVQAKADIALYKAKEAGRGKVVLTP